MTTVIFAADHAGRPMKDDLLDWADEQGWQTEDLGTRSDESVDYPDYAERLADRLDKLHKDLGVTHLEEGVFGVLVCGTGIGISIAANRYNHVRAALCRQSTDARLSRAHNNANVLALGARITGLEVARDTLYTFVSTPFDGGRHEARVAKMC